MCSLEILLDKHMHTCRKQILTRVEDVAITLDSTLGITTVKFEICRVFDEEHIPSSSSSRRLC